MLAIVINTLNEKGQKYKLSQDKNLISAIFGIIANGKKEKVEIIPTEKEVIVKLLEKEKKFDEEGFGLFIDKILELKALQEKENNLIEDLRA